LFPQLLLSAQKHFQINNSQTLLKQFTNKHSAKYKA